MPVLLGLLADEHVEVAVAGDDVQRVAARLARLEPVKRALLALGQERVVAPAGDEGEAGGGLWRLGDEVRRQLGAAVDADELGGVDALLDLLEERQRRG